ncbi:hypothetical protein CR161_05540 [Prosthecochloris sp. ZM]|uniref:response regulator transcription factor n=1 Tax=Prosthecochloris sp. ZM TaxID=2283143 RepID=UPI000DF7B981|nr:response regulator transcription factor [Prosthecochloris sp. ZM]RDD30212.1 hypothetical protein CR161_05540 [Prosthecochloris sp. ZM]
MSTSIFSSVHNKQKVILIDNEQNSRQSLQLFLTGQGFDIKSIGDEQKFLDEINSTAYEVAILDCTHSNADDVALTRYLRTHTPMRIIILSNRLSSHGPVEGYLSGADLYIEKPVDFTVLAAALNSILERCSESQRFHDTCAIKSFHAWILCKANRELIAPDKTRISLTTKEYLFLSRLANATSDVVTRTDLLDILGYEQNEYGHKRLETLVYRIRRKSRQTEFFPLITHHGCGYSFSTGLIAV